MHHGQHQTQATKSSTKSSGRRSAALLLATAAALTMGWTVAPQVSLANEFGDFDDQFGGGIGGGTGGGGTGGGTGGGGTGGGGSGGGGGGGSGGPTYTYTDILINGHFDQPDLFAWTNAGSVGGGAAVPEWGSVSGSVGGVPFGSSDGTEFATPWTDGGGFDNGAQSLLTQLCTLPDVHTGNARVAFEAIWAYDAIRFDLEWFAAGAYDDDGHPLDLTSLGSVDMGSYGGVNGSGVDEYLEILAIPDGATHVRFNAIGELTDGSWLDAGFDQASIVLASPVPEPAGLAAAGLLAGLAMRRRR
ncbi:MAG: hypothetical protein AAGK78_05865 [Planctomycetota bacterium]